MCLCLTALMFAQVTCHLACFIAQLAKGAAFVLCCPKNLQTPEVSGWLVKCIVWHQATYRAQS